VIPAVDVVRTELTFEKRVQSGGRASSVELVEIQPFEVRRDSAAEPEYLITHAGFVSRIIRTLKAYNIPHTYEDVRPLKLEDPCYEWLDTPREGQDVILAKIISAERGQIVAPTGDGKTWIICQVCKLFPHAKVLIVSPGRSEAKTVRDRLLSIFPHHEVGLVGAGRDDTNCRITVCVRNSLGKVINREKHVCDIFMYDEVHTAAGPKTSRILASVDDCKMFGFTASAEMRTDKADMLVEAYFGPVIHETTYSESQDRGNIVPIKVILRSVPAGPHLSVRTATARNRHGLWRNKLRNQMIAQDARKLTEHDEQILITVATVEHGLELLRYLPGYAFVYGSMRKQIREKYEEEGVLVSGEHPISAKKRERLQELFREGKLRRVISTCWNQGVDFPHLQVLIRAEGTDSSIKNIQTPGRLSRTSDGKALGILVDYLDEFDTTLRRRAQKRVRMYRKRGWDVQAPRMIGGAHISGDHQPIC
jgi:superfamily II DNA or RNA helicase